MGGMTFITNAGALATRKRVLAGRTEARFRQAAQVQAAKMKWLAVGLSSGGLSTSMLTAMGHPYAARLPAGSAGFPDFLINAQTGRFRASWVCRAQRTPLGWTITVWNTDPKAQFMLGTGRMRPRPILDEVQRRSGVAMAAAARGIQAATAREYGGTAPVPAGAPSAWSAAGGVLYAAGVGLASVAGALSESVG